MAKAAPRAKASSKKQWLITGGTGFFGTAMAWYLIKKGIRPILLDIAPIDDPGLVGKVDYLNNDVRDAVAVDAAVSRAAVVVHAAAALPLEPPQQIWTTTVNGAENVFGACLKYGVKKSVHIGTTAVYGIPRVHPLYEDSLLVPLGTYGEAKCEAEQVIRRLRRKGLDATIIRPKTFIGTGRLGVFQILFDWVESGVRIPVLGDGNNQYQLMDVQDLCHAVYLSGTTKKPGDDYNVGAMRYTTVKADVGALCNHAGNGAKVWPVPSEPAKVALRVMEFFNWSPLYKWVYETCDHDSYVDTTKIQKALGWKAKYSNAETLCNTYDWYLKEGKPMALRSGTTHRVAWKQGLLGFVKGVLKVVR